MTSEKLIEILLDIGFIEEYNDIACVTYQGTMDGRVGYATRRLYFGENKEIIETWNAFVVCKKGAFHINIDNPTPEQVWKFFYDFDESDVGFETHKYRITIEVDSIEDRSYLVDYLTTRKVFLDGTTVSHVSEVTLIP